MVLPLLALVAAAPLQAAAPPVDDQCTYLPQYRALQTAIADVPPEAALPKLYAYAADPANENPVGCDAGDIDSAISKREQSLIALDRGGAPVAPQGYSHCDKFVPRSIVCNGYVADGTGQPDGQQIMTPLPAMAKTGTIRTRIPGARLVGLYRTTLRDVQSGRPAIKLTGTVVPAMKRGTVLIALFDGLKHWRYGKAVWYF
jgi:hypothetical protein